jgi:hypothetical protein
MAAAGRREGIMTDHPAMAVDTFFLGDEPETTLLQTV